MESLQEYAYQEIKSSLENDPEGKALEATELWKKITA
jgi:hypothetical protein